ncbi:hypothetical protein [Actinoplanes utahensis]|uniref:hypothetical protein n=2 Tax=Actinoplanes utahensis TaxID=1869 RepID=UPI00194F4019|nr:hypothetical protein [Actinoplanes utahensis]GIF28278.1 hypothetical protein Aut01nite_12640 [Actinoplanes utahensis]
MGRGPLGLFGAIVAVGLGPALWLGAQLGVVNRPPQQRPVQVEQRIPGVEMDFGGAGAGEPAGEVDPVAPYSYEPLTSPTTTDPPRRRSSPAPAASTPGPARTEPSRMPSPDPSTDPSTSDPAPPSGEPSTSTGAGPDPSESTPEEDPTPSEEPSDDETAGEDRPHRGPVDGETAR